MSSGAAWMFHRVGTRTAKLFKIALSVCEGWRQAAQKNMSDPKQQVVSNVRISAFDSCHWYFKEVLCVL